MKTLLVVMMTIVLTGCDYLPKPAKAPEPKYQYYHVFDQAKRAELFTKCVESIKLQKEANLAGLDSAIKKCGEAATDLSAGNVVKLPIDTAIPCWGQSGLYVGYCLITKETYERELNK